MSSFLKQNHLENHGLYKDFFFNTSKCGLKNKSETLPNWVIQIKMDKLYQDSLKLKKEVGDLYQQALLNFKEMLETIKNKRILK